jgi:hypothetical protein
MGGICVDQACHAIIAGKGQGQAFDLLAWLMIREEFEKSDRPI